MAKSSDVYKAKSVQKLDVDDESWKTGLEPLEIELPADVMVEIEKFAEETNISVSDAVSIALAEWLRKRRELEKSVGKMVKKAFDEEFNRITEELLFFYSRNKGKKKFSNY